MRRGAIRGVRRGVSIEIEEQVHTNVGECHGVERVESTEVLIRFQFHHG